MSRTTFIPHDAGRFRGVAVPRNRMDGENLGLAIIVEDSAAFERATMTEIRREARVAGVKVVGTVPDDHRLIVVTEMPDDPARMFIGLGGRIDDVRSQRHEINLRDDGEVLARFTREAKQWDGAGEGTFAPISLGKNLNGVEVTQRIAGRTFAGRKQGEVHAEWHTHPDGNPKAHGPRKALFLRAGTTQEFALLARTLVARLDRDQERVIREREIKELLELAKMPDGVQMGMAQFRELIEMEVTATAQVGGTANRDAATRLSLGFPPYTERSGMKLVRAQFSTPPGISFAAAEFLKPGGRTILEPTIGNGVLAAVSAARGGLVVGVEIDEGRAARATQALGASARIRVGDALVKANYPDSPLSDEGFDAVLANPPYMRLSETSTDDREIKSQIDLKSLGVKFESKTAETLIAAESIEMLKTGGNAVFVMPAEMMKPTEINGHRRQFQALLNTAFEKVDSVVLDADLYASMGSRFPVIVHFCEDKRTPDRVPAMAELKNLAPEAYPLVDSYQSFYGFVDKVLENSKIADLAPSQVEANRSAWMGVEPALLIEAAGVADDAADAEAEAPRDPAPIEPGARGAGGPGGSGGDGRAPRNRAAPPAGGEGRPGPVDPEPEAREADPDDEPEAEPAPADDLSVDLGGYGSFYTDDFEDDPLTAPYRAASNKPGVESVIERSMEAGLYSALHRLTNEVGSVDSYVANALGVTEEWLLSKEGPLSPEQIDSVALSIHNRTQKKATILGDLMGVGKGRQLAAHMVTAITDHRPVLAMTNKQHLFRDLIVRDLGALAGQPVRELIEDGRLKPFIFNQTTEARLTERDGKTLIFGTSPREITEAKRAGTVPEDKNLVVTTYSQFAQKPSHWKVEAIKAWIDSHADAGKPPVLLLDEVHEAAGEDSWTGAVMRGLLDHANDRGCEIVYSSATSMKSGKNLNIYKYALPDTGMSIDQLRDVIDASPLEMQEIISSEMAREGLMVQRKMPSAGVERETQKLADVDVARMEEAREMWADFAEFISEMVSVAPEIKRAAKAQFTREMSGVAHAGSGAGGLDVTTTSPASMYDNVSRYFLLAIKGRFLPEMVDDVFARGEKLTILQELTGDTLAEYVRSGSLLDEAADEQEIGKDNESGKGGPEKDVDDVIPPAPEDADGQVVDAHPHLGHVLKRMVERLITAKGTDALGGQTVLTVRAFEGWAQDIKARIDAADFRAWRTNTFDLAEEVCAQKGLNFVDITKRRWSFKTGSDGLVRMSPRQIPEKMSAAYDYNRGGFDVMGLNNAAATGMSVQASPLEGPDLRRRVMLFMSFLKNTADHTQAEGRVDRKGQVVPPRYVIPNSGFVADDRLASLFNRGNRNLSSMTAGTRESRRTIEDVVDLLNPIGDSAVRMTFMRNPALADALGINISDETPVSDLGRKFLGRAFILGPDMSAAAINEVDMSYVALLDKMTREGTNPLRLGHYDWKANVETVDVLEEGDESARGLAAQPLKLVEFSWEQDRPVEKASHVLNDVGEYIQHRKEPFQRLDHRLDLDRAREYGHPKWDHAVYDEVTGRKKLGASGLVFPVPMTDDSMSEIATGLRYQIDRVVDARGGTRGTQTREDIANAIRGLGDALAKMTDRALAHKANPEENPEVPAQERRMFAAVLKQVTEAMEGKKPAFAGFKWARAIRLATDRAETVADVEKYAGIVEPGRIVAVNARALRQTDEGILSEAMREVGAFDLDRSLWLPAIVTAARYKDDLPLSAGGFNVSLSIPGTQWRVSTTMSALQSNLEVAGREHERAIAPISEFNEMVRSDLVYTTASFYDHEIDRAFDRMKTEGSVGLIGKALFGDKLRAVARAVGDYNDEASLAKKLAREKIAAANHAAGKQSSPAEWKELGTRHAEMAVETPSIRNPAPEKLFATLASSVPQGKVTKRRFGLTGNLLAAAAATVTKGRAKSLGEKAVVTGSNGENINTYLIPFGDAKSIVAKVKERSAAKSAVQPAMTGSPEKVAAMIGLLAVAEKAAYNGSFRDRDTGNIDLWDADTDTFESSLKVLFPEALSSDVRKSQFVDRESEVMSEMASRLTEMPKTFPSSLMVGGDVWAQSAVAADSGEREKIMSPTSIRGRKTPGGRMLGAYASTAPGVLHDAVRNLDRDQLLLLFDKNMEGTLLFRKTHPGVKDMAPGSVAERVVTNSTTKADLGGRDVALTKGLMAFTFDASHEDSRKLAAEFMVEAGRAVNGLNAEFMVGGYGKMLLNATRSTVRERIKSADLSVLNADPGVERISPEPEISAPPVAHSEHVEPRPRGDFAPGG